jgi:hypothetical protein
MPHPKPNPLFVKKPGETPAQHMRRLRKEFPKKFGVVPSDKRKKWWNATQVEAEKKRAVEKALADAGKALAAAENRVAEKALAEKKTEAELTTSSPPASSQLAPPPTIPPTPAETLTPGPATPDSAIFGASTPPPPKVDATSPGSPPPPPPEPPQGTPGVSAPPLAPPPPDNLGLATIVWTMLVNLFVAIFGPAWLPTSKDETEMCVSAWRGYFESIGIKPFSPLVNLWLAMFAYAAPRFGSIVAKFRKKKPTPPGAAPAPAGPELEKKEPGTPVAKATPSIQPSPAAPAPATEAVDLDDEHFGAM